MSRLKDWNRVKVSEAGRRALERLSAEDEGCNALELGVRIATMEILEEQGLVRKQRGSGSYAYPLTGITWLIAPRGLAWLDENKESSTETVSPVANDGQQQE